jgi:hypothetical protein
MAESFPDLLDHLGKTPREFGAVHVHVEPVARGEGGRAVATVWLQAAFAPLAPEAATLMVLEHTWELPRLEGGVVMRGQLPLSVPAEAQKLMFVVTSRLHEKAERVRPAWKLFDTWEMPHEERGGGDDGLDGLAGIALANVVALPLGFAVIPTGLLSHSAAGATRSRAKVHKATELPPGFVAEVVRGTPEELEAPVWTEVWRPGQELPRAAFSVWGGEVALPQVASGSRRCGSCDFSGKRADFGGDRYCPQCGHEWD